MVQSWPLKVGLHEIVPVECPGGWGSPVHLAEELKELHQGALRPPAPALSWLVPPPAAGNTLCGRPYVAVRTDPGLDLLGDDNHELCRSCWRSVERWLSPPPAVPGEDEVLRWVTAVVLEIGEAMVDGVPVPRLESVRRQARSQIKAAIGGSVTTRVIGRDTLWVHSRLVLDAKTPEQLQREMRAALERMERVQAGQAVDPPRWRRCWNEIVGGEQALGGT